MASFPLLAAACAGPDVPDEASNLATTRQALTDEDPTLNPVVVTSGTCASNGFRPLETVAACNAAEDVVLSNGKNVSAPLGSGGAAQHGCSVSVVAVPFHGGPVGLGTVFNPGSASQLEDQACTHNAPCVCNDEVTTTPVCNDGAFEPDPHKYFTIRSANGRYIRSTSDTGSRSGTILLTRRPGDAREPYEQPGRDYDYNATVSPSDIRLHWRFEESPQGVSVINRRTGQRLSVGPVPSGHHYDTDGDVLTSSSAGSPWTATCRGAQVLLETAGGSPLDAGGLLRDNGRTLNIALPLVFTEPQSPGFERLGSKCFRKSRSCTSTFGSEYVRTDRKLCGTFHDLHALQCTRTVDAPLSMHVPQGWYIEEVHTYSRAASFDPAPITVDPLTSPSAVASSLASFGESTLGTFGAASVTVLTNATTFAKGSGPLYGAMFAIGLNAAFEFLPAFGVGIFDRPDPVDLLAEAVSDALQQLSVDLTAQTEVMIDNGLAQESARALDARMSLRRLEFYTLYPDRKENRLALDSNFQTLSLANEVFGNASEFRVDIEEAFPNLGPSPSELDLRRAHFALDTAKLATTEQMIMLAEGVLVEALGEDGLTCDQIVFDRGLQFFADFSAAKLEGAVDELVKYGRSSAAHRLSMSKDEFEFDARNFSYPIQPQLEFFRRIVAETKSKCRLLRDPQSSFRQHFIDNTPMPLECHGNVAAGDSDSSGTCDDVVAAMAAPWTEVSTAGSVGGASLPLLDDVDGDGVLDLVTRHHNQRRLVQWTNTGGALAAQPSLSVPLKPSGHELSDLDGDGDLDFVTGGSSRLLFAEKTETGISSPQTITGGVAFRSVIAMPVDGDVLPDLVTFDRSNQQLLLYLNVSDEQGISFAPETVIDRSVSSTSFDGPGLAALDADRDGDLDLVVSTGELIVYLNEGGSFSAPTIVDNVDLGSSIRAADVDGDGDGDIVGLLGSSAVWYENVGDGDFEPRGAMVEEASPRASP
ncbi:MAG: VCBS repeat-containing protein [Myxococcota bacterium]